MSEPNWLQSVILETVSDVKTWPSWMQKAAELQSTDEEGHTPSTSEVQKVVVDKAKIEGFEREE